VPVGDGLVLSVVSHGQRELLLGLFEDLTRHVHTPFRVVLTENLPEEPAFPFADYPYPIEVIRNKRVKGFGANHNSALDRAGDGKFCVLNPDIRLSTDPFPELCKIADDARIGVVAPQVIGPDHSPEDHARDFPSVFTLAAKLFGYRSFAIRPANHTVYFPDWVAGMFMVFRADTMRTIGGFDERYFLYYEDVDLCARMRECGLEVAVCTTVSVIHAARRASRKNIRFALRHFRSALRFLASRPRLAFGLRKRNRSYPMPKT
jgi:N-acetylglucosaminyl-diphospho-decaprenol L-rhamnosyltransferase